jgi:hypothetical protein
MGEKMNKKMLLMASTILPLMIGFQNCAENMQTSTSMNSATDEIVAENEVTEGKTTGLPKFTSAELNDALSRPLTNFTKNSSGTNAAYFGPASVVIAYSAYSGNAVAQKKLLTQLRYNIVSGHEPSAAGGYPAQHELIFAMTAAFAKKTPAVWNSLSSAEKHKIDLIMEGLAVAAAYTSSDKNPTHSLNLVGGQSWPTASANFAAAPIGNLVAVGSYFGDSALTSRLNTFNHTDFGKQVKAAGLSQLYFTFQPNGPRGANGQRPTASQISSAIKNWRWIVTRSNDLETNIQGMVKYSFGNVIEAGYNNGKGVNGRAKIMKGATGLPNKGKVGMVFELNSNDAEGIRSSMSYAMWTVRINLSTLLLAVSEGYRMPTSIKNQLSYGMVDMKYKTTQGYYSYAHAGGGNSEDWNTSRTQQWGLTYSFGMYFDVIAKY